MPDATAFAPGAEAGEKAAMTRTWVLAALSLLVALAALGVALGSERYRRAGAVRAVPGGAVAVPDRAAVGRGRAGAGRGAASRLVLWGVVLCMAASVALAAVHVGVEQGWWPSPLPECAAPDLGGGSIAERLARMPAHPAKPCDDPTYLVPGLPRLDGGDERAGGPGVRGVPCHVAATQRRRSRP